MEETALSGSRRQMMTDAETNCPKRELLSTPPLRKPTVHTKESSWMSSNPLATTGIKIKERIVPERIVETKEKKETIEIVEMLIVVMTVRAREKKTDERTVSKAKIDTK